MACYLDANSFAPSSSAVWGGFVSHGQRVINAFPLLHQSFKFQIAEVFQKK